MHPSSTVKSFQQIFLILYSRNRECWPEFLTTDVHCKCFNKFVCYSPHLLRNGHEFILNSNIFTNFENVSEDISVCVRFLSNL